MVGTVIRRLFSGTPANVHAIGMAFTTVSFVLAVLSVGLYVSMTGDTVNVSAGLYGFSANRIHDGPSYFILGREGSFATVYHTGGGWATSEAVIGPGFLLNPRYEPAVFAVEYPLLPVMVDIYKRITPPSSSTPH